MKFRLCKGRIHKKLAKLGLIQILLFYRKLTLLQDELQRSESKLSTTTTDLNDASNRTDEINRAIKTLETKNMIDEERNYFLSTHNYILMTPICV